MTNMPNPMKASEKENPKGKTTPRIFGVKILNEPIIPNISKIIPRAIVAGLVR
jgi:hypothetical protein